MIALILSIESAFNPLPAVALSIAPAIVAAIISGIAGLGGAAIGASSAKKDREAGVGADLSGLRPAPTKSKDDDAVKKMLIMQLANKRKAEAAEAGADEALQEEVIVDIGGAQSRTRPEASALEDLEEEEEEEEEDEQVAT